MAILQSTSISSTGTFKLPRGTTAQRPGSPSAGMARFNTSLNYTEVYNGAAWVRFTPDNVLTNPSVFGQVATASGTHLMDDTGIYRTHWFLSGSHTFTPLYTGYVEVLVVAGGGGGGTGGGGGGAGGLVYNSAFAVTGGTA